MMTIKGFASLCDCNPQTLRYYDRIGLLKPVRVDRWSGYRYYDPAQAIDFVKIKNLQAADFTIDEIRGLLAGTDQEICDAFSRKIEEQRQKLERICEIQRSYLTEKSTMENIVQSVSDFVLGQCRDLEVLREFGLSPADGPAILELLREYLNRHLLSSATGEDVTLTVNDEVVRGAEQVMDRLRALSEDLASPEGALPSAILLGEGDTAEHIGSRPEDYDCLWERHGWAHVHEFIDLIPALEEGVNYCFQIHLKDERKQNDISISFGVFMVGAMLFKRPEEGAVMSCTTERSEDGENHFRLLRRK